MDCPVCKLAMLGLELEGVEIDHCPECGGVWLDEGELEDLAGGEAAAAGMLSTAGKAPRTREKRRRCPRCLRRMAKIQLADGPNLVLDRCHHGLWFDRGELARLLRSGGGSPAARRMAEHLLDLFRKER